MCCPCCHCCVEDTNLRPVASWHPTLPHTVYHAMDWLCPNFNQVMAKQLQGAWGQLTPERAIRDIMPIVQTGNLHIYVADLIAQQLYLSFMANDNSTSIHRAAYDRQYAQIDLNQLFQVTQKIPSIATIDSNDNDIPADNKIMLE